MKRARCFVSYSSSDAKTEEISAIISYMNKLAKQREYNIEFLFDRDLGVGNDLNKFMKEIKNVDSIIVICTPDYKKKYMNEDGKQTDTGVYKESELIKKRIEYRNSILTEKNKEQNDNPDYVDIDFCVFPLVLSLKGNSSEDSVPDFLTNYVRKKINKIEFVTEKGRVEISKKSKEEYKSIFLHCIISTCVIYSKKSKYIGMDICEKLDKLIYNQKAEYAPLLTKKLFVNTFYYEQIKNQESYMLIGRKGSGKTTTKLYFHSNNKEKYKGVIELKIDKLNLEQIYTYLFHSPFDGNINLKKDIEEIFTYEKVIEYIWVIYIYIYSMYVVACEYKTNLNSMSQGQKRKFKKTYVFINDILSLIDYKQRWKNGENISATIYNYAMSNVYRFFNEIIRKTRNDERFFASDLQAQLTHGNLIKFVIGGDVVSSFYSGLEECEKKILFSLDGFDTASDIFRKKTLSSSIEEQAKKILFEIRWISSLMELVQDIKGIGGNPLYRLLDICFLIPKDLFIEVLELNRDKYKYSSRFCEISWTGMELAIMVRKRLEALNAYPLTEKDKNEKLPEDILALVLERFYKSLPNKIVIKTNDNREYYVDLFLYMLRYSFWRPRDILAQLSLILRIFYGHSKTGIPINLETIKTTIKAASVNIVNSEFFNEFDSVWKDIRENIYMFERTTLLLQQEDIKKVILSNKFKIKLEMEDKEIQGYKEKIKFLYEIGFLGIFVNKNYKDKYQMVTKQGFAFSEGTSCLSGFLADDFEECCFMINPVFIETLHLSINTDEYIGIQSWNDLRELERRIQIKMKTDCFS